MIGAENVLIDSTSDVLCYFYTSINVFDCQPLGRLEITCNTISRIIVQEEPCSPYVCTILILNNPVTAVPSSILIWLINGFASTGKNHLPLPLLSLLACLPLRAHFHSPSHTPYPQQQRQKLACSRCTTNGAQQKYVCGPPHTPLRRQERCTV